MQKRINDSFPKEFHELIKASTDGIRIIADAHIEWLDFEGLPLCIQKNVSRIPVTPGNLFVEQASAQGLIHVTPESFREVLVISALKRSDPIKKTFELAFEHFGKLWKDKLDLKVVEVDDEKGFVEALNEFKGGLVVFDGHGSHPEEDTALLHLKDKSVNVWELRDQIKRPPPIIVLSACDTHAADRNHVTTGNGFLSLGSRVVLGSVFPLDARDAAIFSARLLYRISEWIPAAHKSLKRSITWIEVVSGMLRMQLMTDFLRRLVRKKIIEESSYKEIALKGNEFINFHIEKPFDKMIDELKKRDIDKNLLKRELEGAVANSSTISYLHMGRPETILIHSEESLKDVLRLS